MSRMIRGVVPVLATPFEPDGHLDRRSFRRLCEHVCSQPISAVMFPGFASEHYKLDDDERMVLARDLLDVAAEHPNLTVVLSVSRHATYGAVRDAQSFVDMGAGAVNLLPPSLMAPTTSAVLDHVAAVLAAVDGTPVVLQYAPGETSVTLDAGSISAVAAAHPNLVAVKVEARPPYEVIAQLRQQTPTVPVLVGSGGLYLLESLRCGAIGVQPGSSFVEVYRAIWDLWTAGDEKEASDLYSRLLCYLVGWAVQQEPIVAIEKRIATRRGLIAHDHCRQPHRSIGRADQELVDRFLAEFSTQLRPPQRSLETRN